MRGLNSETISIYGGILGGFTELSERSNLPKTLVLKVFGDVPRSNCGVCDKKCCTLALSVEGPTGQDSLDMRADTNHKNGLDISIFEVVG